MCITPLKFGNNDYAILNSLTLFRSEEARRGDGSLGLPNRFLSITLEAFEVIL